MDSDGADRYILSPSLRLKKTKTKTKKKKKKKASSEGWELKQRKSSLLSAAVELLLKMHNTHFESDHCERNTGRRGERAESASVFSDGRISSKRGEEDFKAAFPRHQRIPWIIDLSGRFIKQHT